MTNHFNCLNNDPIVTNLLLKHKGEKKVKDSNLQHLYLKLIC